MVKWATINPAHHALMAPYSGSLKFVKQTVRLYLGGKFPSHADSFRLEVVTKAEVPQHFKEAVVARSHPNILQIISAYALLCCCCLVVLPIGLQSPDSMCCGGNKAMNDKTVTALSAEQPVP